MSCHIPDRSLTPWSHRLFSVFISMTDVPLFNHDGSSVEDGSTVDGFSMLPQNLTVRKTNKVFCVRACVCV